jgi:hypothetical protein
MEMMRNFSVIQKVSPQLFTQSELKYVIRDLGLPKEKAELLGSSIKEKSCWQMGHLGFGTEAENRSLQVTFHRMVTCSTLVIFLV